MKLIKVGNTIINLNQVTEINLNREYEDGLGLQLWYVGGSVHFKNAQEAEALRYYFTDKAIDLDLDYQNYLTQQELKKYRSEWRQRFNQFSQEKELDQDTIYHYEWWLNEGDDGPALDGRQPGEETFAAWLSVAEEQITERIEKMGIPAKDKEAFKAHCVAERTTNPSWNTFKFWKNEQPTTVGF